MQRAKDCDRAIHSERWRRGGGEACGGAEEARLAEPT